VSDTQANTSTGGSIRLPDASAGQLRSARRLLRRKERAARAEFLAEGPQAVREALAVPDRVLSLLITDRATQRHSDLLDRAARGGVACSRISEDDLGSVTDASTPQGIVAVCRAIDVPLDQVLAGRPKLVVCCAEIRDPGNAGTVIRCADAAGADAVVLGRESVDLYNPKTVRATTGSLFHLPVVVEADLAIALAGFRDRGMQVLAAAGGATVDLDDLAASGELARPTVWLMGNEARGLSGDQLALADRAVSVPIYGRAESLNLSTAAAVCLYASAFARHRPDGR
jgi:TrmH family RNA methyltransferase